jgi:hypothetical protein
MSSVKPLKEVVQHLAETFNNPQTRESSYFDFYDDSLMIHLEIVVNIKYDD